MKKNGNNIASLLSGLFVAAAFACSCSDGNNGLEDSGNLAEKTTLSISFHPAQQAKAANGVRANSGGGIEPEVFQRESAIYSLAVLVFKTGSDELNGTKFINRTVTPIPGTSFSDYAELDEIKDIGLTAGIRDVYIIANAPDNHFNSVANRNDFKAKMEELSAQGMYAHPSGSADPGEPPISGLNPDDRYTNLAMSLSFTGLPINSGADKHYLGYTSNGGRPTGVSTGTPLNGTNSVELVRLAARVAIQKIAFNLPATMTFDGTPTTGYSPYVDTVFIFNAQTQSTYFPEDNAFPVPSAPFGHGNTPGYELLSSAGSFSGMIPPGGVYEDFLYKPIRFQEYDIEENDVPLWFYAFENKSGTVSPTGFVVGVKYLYEVAGNIEAKKVYYPIIINQNGSANGADHNHIKRNNQYGIKVTITGLSTFVTGYNGTRSAAAGPVKLLSAQDTGGVVEIEETVGADLFPWTGNVYKK